tara:strand:+ start:6306 stop:7289 length:984 start_codon:yes stop_codon:yes gene_type:complete
VSQATQHRKAFRDIVKGFSPAELGCKTAYIKHLSPHDQVELEDIEGRYYRIAQTRGLPTEEEMLAFLKQEGDWTDVDEKEISQGEGFIESLQKSKANLVLKSAQEQQGEVIKKETIKLNKKLNQKKDLLGNTCEEYGKSRAHDFYILKSFYSDKKLKKPLYSEDEYNELTQPEVSGLVGTYNKIFASFTEESVQSLILEDFYQPYLNFGDDSMQFYGKAFCELTYNQIRMIVYTRIFKNIFENNANIPEGIRKDPAALLDYGSISDSEKEKVQSKFDESAGSTIVGASQEDYEYLGVKQTGGVSLHEEAKKKGGSLSMQDMMKLSGV